jgi:hypothetical protein
MPSMVSSLSLGNLGGADVHCAQNSLVFNSIHLHCPVGRIYTKNNLIFGVASSQAASHLFCERESLNEYAKSDK